MHSQGIANLLIQLVILVMCTAMVNNTSLRKFLRTMRNESLKEGETHQEDKITSLRDRNSGNKNHLENGSQLISKGSPSMDKENSIRSTEPSILRGKGPIVTEGGNIPFPLSSDDSNSPAVQREEPPTNNFPAAVEHLPKDVMEYEALLNDKMRTISKRKQSDWSGELIGQQNSEKRIRFDPMLDESTIATTSVVKYKQQMNREQIEDEFVRMISANTEKSLENSIYKNSKEVQLELHNNLAIVPFKAQKLIYPQNEGQLDGVFPLNSLHHDISQDNSFEQSINKAIVQGKNNEVIENANNSANNRNKLNDDIINETIAVPLLQLEDVQKENEISLRRSDRLKQKGIINKSKLLDQISMVKKSGKKKGIKIVKSVRPNKKQNINNQPIIAYGNDNNTGNESTAMEGNQNEVNGANEIDTIADQFENMITGNDKNQRGPSTNSIVTSPNSNQHEGEEEEFEIEKILCHGFDNKNELLLLIKWLGHGTEANSWEPIKSLDHIELVGEYERKYKAGEIKQPREVCAHCGKGEKINVSSVQCRACAWWVHQQCAKLGELPKEGHHWLCQHCRRRKGTTPRANYMPLESRAFEAKEN